MSRLEWDKSGARFYETGIDRGVLYLADDTAVPWNGLMSIEEDQSAASSESIYFLGEKVNNSQQFGDYSAVLKAYTYPDEFEEFEGSIDLGSGLSINGQSLVNCFGLSYRTRVGNDVDGYNHGYKVHIVYNLTAISDTKSYNTLSNDTNVLEFSWLISAIPQAVTGYRPTAHIILDSRKISIPILLEMENILYGTSPTLAIDGQTPAYTSADIIDGNPQSPLTIIDGNTTVAEPTPARLPTINELISLTDKLIITDHGDGTWSAADLGQCITMLDDITFEIDVDSAVYLDADTYEISSQT